MPNDLTTQYAARLPLLDQLRLNLERETTDALQRLPHIDRIIFRTKSAASFVAKATDSALTHPYQDPLVEIEDQVAGRVLVFFRQDLAPVQQRLLGSFTSVERQQRRPARDAEFGYETDHLICVIPPHVKPDGWKARTNLPHTFEIQIRTLFMHAYAEPQHDLAYKASTELPRDIRRELAWIAASAWGADEAYGRIHDWENQQRKNSTPGS